jgi:hypothetical protein
MYIISFGLARVFERKDLAGLACFSVTRRPTHYSSTEGHTG